MSKPRTIIGDPGFACRCRAGRRAAALCRPHTGPRSHLPTGLLRPSRTRTQGSPAGPYLRHNRSLDAHDASQSADYRPESPRHRWRNSRMRRSLESPVTGSKATGRASCTLSVLRMDSARPGMTDIRGDSHTATHGAFWGWRWIGTSEVDVLLATRCAVAARGRVEDEYEIRVDGNLRQASRQDIYYAIIAKIGVGGGTGCVSFCGSAIRSLSMEKR